MSWNGYERNVLLLNRGSDDAGVPRFVDVARALGADVEADGRGMAVADFDDDGDLDIVINHNPGDHGLESIAPSLLRNDWRGDHHWLAVDLVGTACNRDAVGAVVELTVAPPPGEEAAAGRRMLRLVAAGSGYASQSARRLSFGLGAAERVERLDVVWPGGEREAFGGLGVDQLVTITQGASVVGTPVSASYSPAEEGRGE